MAKEKKVGLYLWEGNFPPAMTNEENLRLIKEYKQYGDKEIRNKIVLGNMRLISHIVSKYTNYALCCESSAYPHMEDLYQQAIFACVKAIERFNTDYTFTFATYLVRGIKNEIGMMYRSATNKGKKEVQVVSLHDATIKNSRHQDDEGMNVEEAVEDETTLPEHADNKLELNYIREKVASLLPKRERDMFYDYYEKKQTLETIAKKYNLSRSYMTRLVEKTRETINRIYLNGPSEEDLLFKGVDQSFISTFKKSNAIVKKHGRTFLVECFMPTLEKKDQKVFERFINCYYSQNMKDLAEGSGLSANHYGLVLDEILEKLDKEAPVLKEEYLKTKRPKKLSYKIQQEINRTNRLIENYGGKSFLAKYFMPTLSGREKKMFEERFLCYYGQPQTEMSKKIGIAQNNFSRMYSVILDKLEKADFETIVDVIDNADQYKTEVKNLIPEKVDKIKERMAIVKQYGGIVKLEEYFMPILSASQKKIFENLYLRPKHDSLLTASKDLDMLSGAIINGEKLILEKLKSTNIEELINIRKQAENELKLDNSQTKEKSMNRKFVEKNGGEEYLREVFLPMLEIKSHKIIFTKYILEGKSTREVLEELKLPRKGINYLRKTANLVKLKLRNYKACHEDFEKEVKDFYMKKKFEKAHPENFEEIAYGKKEEDFAPIEEKKELSIKDIGQEADYKVRKEFVENYLSKFGTKKELVRNFLPTIKKIVDQQVFLGSFLECHLDEVVMKKYQLTKDELASAKNNLLYNLKQYKSKKIEK